MTLERIKGEIVFECDGKKCHEFLETNTDDFGEALGELETAGWLTRRYANAWVHVCPDCQEAEHGLVV